MPQEVTIAIDIAADLIGAAEGGPQFDAIRYPPARTGRAGQNSTMPISHGHAPVEASQRGSDNAVCSILGALLRSGPLAVTRPIPSRRPRWRRHFRSNGSPSRHRAFGPIGQDFGHQHRHARLRNPRRTLRPASCRRASPAGQSPLPVRQAMSLTSASCAVAQAGFFEFRRRSAVCDQCLRPRHRGCSTCQRLIAVTTLESQPPSGIGSRWVDTSHQPAE